MNSPAEPRTLSEQLHVLRLRGQLAEARELIRGQPAYAASAALKRLALEHEDFWWMPIEGRRVVLRRRGPDDAAFVRTCWADGEFMRKFNRLARPLPADDGELRAILARERAGLLQRGQGAALDHPHGRRSCRVRQCDRLRSWPPPVRIPDRGLAPACQQGACGSR
jgi:hypothetical protein